MTVTAEAKKRLLGFEGEKWLPYDDKTGETFTPGMQLRGNLTIGVGYNLHRGITAKISEVMLEESIMEAILNLLNIFPSFSTYSEGRRVALIDMMFNLGVGRFGGFKRMIKAIQGGDWKEAAKECLDSYYADDGRPGDTGVEKRARENAELLERG